MVKAVVFDVGGVLLDDPELIKFWRDKEGAKKLRSQFGTGNLTRQEFVADGAELLGITEERFIEEYSSAYSGMKKDNNACSVYRKVRKPKYIFSDTNPIHFKYCEKLYPELFEKADKLFLSFQINLRKSNLDSFRKMLGEVPYKPEELIFIDNNEEYIDSARSLGVFGITYVKGMDLEQAMLDIDMSVFD